MAESRPEICESVDPELNELVLAIASGDLSEVAPVGLQAGRSITFALKTNPAYHLKIKGALGVNKEQEGRLLIVPRQPQMSYTVPGQTPPHLRINSGWRFECVPERPKANCSLRLSGAKREYHTQRRLGEMNLGLEAICYGHFRMADGSLEKDLYGNETGFVVLRDTPKFVEAAEMLCYWYTGGGRCLIASEGPLPTYARMTSPYHPGSPLLHLNLRSEVHYQMGWVRGEAARLCGLARHSGTVHNFLIDPPTKQVWIKDTDTTLDLSEMSVEERGPQILRDLVSDIFKLLGDFLASFVDLPLYGLSDWKNPVEAYLRGYFEGQVDPGAVTECADAIFLTAIALLEENGALKSLREMDRRSASTYLRISTLLKFYTLPVVAKELHTLLHKSTMGAAFDVSDMPADFEESTREFLSEQWLPAVNDYLSPHSRTTSP